MSKTNNIKNQHYVPQGYLRNFLIPNTKDKIWCKSKVRKKVFAANIRDVGSENYFHELSDYFAKKFIDNFGYSDFNSTETNLNKLESEFLPKIMKVNEACDNLDDARIVQLLYAQEERMWLSIFVVLQYYRTKKYRMKLYQKYYNEGKRELDSLEQKFGFSIYQHSKNIKEIQRVAEEKSRLQHITEIQDYYQLNERVNEIANYTWYIGKNNHSVPLVTSDSPVVEIDNYMEDNVKFKTWLLPLSSRYILIIPFRTIANMSEIPNPIAKDLNLEEVYDFNNLQYQQSYELVFSNCSSVEGIFLG